MQLRYLAPNAVTLANIGAGFCAVLAAAEGRFDLAVYLVVVSIFLDVADGAVARTFKATSEMGQELDSLSDALSFGAAPAFLITHVFLRQLGEIGILCALAYLFCAVLRLARFNLDSDAHSKGRTSTGVPTPIAAGYLLAAVLMREHIEAIHAAVLTVAMAVLMVSKVQLPNLKGRNLVTGTLFGGVVSYLAVVIHPGWPTVIWWNVWNLVIIAAFVAEKRQDEAEEAEL